MIRFQGQEDNQERKKRRKPPFGNNVALDLYAPPENSPAKSAGNFIFIVGSDYFVGHVLQYQTLSEYLACCIQSTPFELFSPNHPV